jgi:chitinase
MWPNNAVSLRAAIGGGIAVLTLLATLPLPSPAAEPLAARPTSEFRVAGYLPDYRLAGFDLNQAQGVTDLILFSAEPTPAGEIDWSRLKSAPWKSIWQWTTAQRVRLILAIGGWDRSAGFAAMSASPTSRKAFAESVVELCLRLRLDGIDLDWEHPEGAMQAAAYGDLLHDLRTALEPHGLSLSVTLAAWQTLDEKAAASADWIQIMSYDNPGRHSTLEQARTDVATFTKRGVPPSRLVLGLPFYGRSVADGKQTRTYAEIAANKKLPGTTDESEGIYFNGPVTIAEKVRWARNEGLAGVMVWELGQDATGDASLLRVIRGSVDGALKDRSNRP